MKGQNKNVKYGMRPLSFIRVSHNGSMMKRISKAICFHEAGHAVMDWYTGHAFHEVRVFIENGCLNGVVTGGGVNFSSYNQEGYYTNLQNIAHLGNDFIEGALISAGISMTTHLAGPIAEARYSHTSFGGLFLYDLWSSCFNTDGKKVESIAAAFSISGKDKRDLIDAAVRKTRKIFGEPGVWDAVCAVADALQKKNTLDFDEVCEAIKERTGMERGSVWDWYHNRPDIRIPRPTSLPPAHLWPEVKQVGTGEFEKQWTEMTGTFVGTSSIEGDK